MNKIRFLILPILSLILSMCQCTITPPSNGTNYIHTDVAWRTLVYHSSYYANLMVGNMFYVVEGYGISAVNLDNGAHLWRINGAFSPNSNIEKIGNYLYIFENYYNPGPGAISNGNTNVRVAKIRTDGSTVEMLTVGVGRDWIPRMFYMSSDANNLYWGTLTVQNTNMLMKFNPVTMERSIIYSSMDEFMGKILITNNIAYVGHIPQEGVGGVGPPGTITVINLSNNTVLWEKTPSYANYVSKFPFVLKDDRLYVIDGNGTACYNALTGAELFDNSNSMGGFYGGCVFEGDYAYFTSPLHGTPRVYCVNRYNGAVKWSDNYVYSLGGTPHVNNGVLYVDAITHLRLYNAKSGELIGIDTNIHGQTLQVSPTFRYGDLMLICGDDGMTAVRMNYTNLK